MCVCVDGGVFKGSYLCIVKDNHGKSMMYCFEYSIYCNLDNFEETYIGICGEKLNQFEITDAMNKNIYSRN